ncbi:MAG: 16S rRNA (cytidine(1402)-2'-O)-methyltransferase [Pseudomonadota bacterium]|nr:16S rRNA (cytidine(1402)-2'-O)-methyltransferase [Pseudomonadota bacterium]
MSTLPAPAVTPGALHVVATPIGNLADLSPRARAVLAGVDLVAAEDTRHSGQLLQQFGIQARLVALHEHNEAQASLQLLARLQEGASVALVCDAGTPAVSDPGARLVALAHAHGITVLAIAGPSALTAALSVAGLGQLPISFHGFLPPKPKARQQALAALAGVTGTLVFYEAPHRIEEMCADLALAFGGTRDVVLSRELTKRFESSHRCRLDQVVAWLAADADHRRGEFVLVVEGAPASTGDDGLVEGQRVFGVLRESLSLSEAVRVAARISGARRSALYAWAQTLASAGDDTGRTPDPGETDDTDEAAP